MQIDANRLFGRAPDARRPEEPADHDRTAAGAGAPDEAFADRFASTCPPDGGAQERAGKEPVERG